MKTTIKTSEHTNVFHLDSIFTFFGVFLEVAALWAYRKGNTTAPIHEKHCAEAGPRAPLDAPAEPVAPAGTV